MKILAIALAVLANPLLAQVPQGAPNADFAPAFAEQTRAPALPETPVTAQVFARGLEHPWGIAPIPGLGFLVTERPGRLRLIAPNGEVSGPVSGVPVVDNRRQGGLLDVVASPNFATDRTIFMTYAKPLGGRQVATAVARAELSADGSSLTNLADVFVQSPPSSSPMHYGSRVIFDRQGRMFVTLGEHSSASERVLAQDISTTYGKVIRIMPDGAIPSGNPFLGRDGADEIWSLGHRNPQGAAIGPNGDLWTIEHGPRGGDELNKPEPGGNYGWPIVSYGIDYSGAAIGQGIASAQGMEEPVYYWDPVIAPGGMMFHNGQGFVGWQGDLLIGSLNPGGVVRLKLRNGRVIGEERILPGVGRVRDVEILPDGRFLILTDAANGAVLLVSPGG